MGSPSNETFDITLDFDRDAFDRFLEKSGAIKEAPKNQYQRGFWLMGKVTITLYDASVVLQGKVNAHPEFVRSLKTFSGLKARSAKENQTSFPKQHNAIICMKCRKPSLVMEATERGLEILFTKQCGHQDDMSLPLLMINKRILPDISVLVSKSLSRVIELGAFAGYEILIPKFSLAVIDTLDGARKASANEEVGLLKTLEHDKDVIVRSFPEEYDKSDLDREDNKIIELADVTNSILITSDNNMKAKAIANNRPIIFFDRKAHADTKTAHRMRI